jgi:amino acid adenylation domain-containing protein
MELNTTDNVFLPLTLTQQDIFFDQLHHKDCALYNVGGYIELSNVDISNIGKAHEYLVNNHDVFGIRITNQDQGIDQFISDDRTGTLPCIDFSQYDNCQVKVEQWLTKLFEKPIDIEGNELYQAYLLKVTEQKFYYVGLAHHLIMDGWGFANWARKLGQYYSSLPLKSESKKWKSVVEKDQKYLSSNRYSKDREYWLEKFKDLPELLYTSNYLHNYRHLSSVPSKRKIISIPVDRQQGLKGFAEKFDIPVSQLYLALISIYFGQSNDVSELVIGTPLHNRSGYAEKEMIGVFTSVSPFRVTVNDKQTLTEYFKKIKSTVLSDFKHQRFPLGHIQRDIFKGKEKRRLYDVGFNYLKLDSNFEISNMLADLVYRSHNHEQTPIMITVWEYGTEQPVQIQVDYNLAYFSEEDCNLIIGRLDWMLSYILDSSPSYVSDVKFIPETERKKILALSTGDIIDFSKDVLVHHLFEHQVKVNPDKIALCWKEQKVTFAQLNEVSNKIAHFLLSKGSCIGDFIGIYLERSIEMVAAILATIKVGATYISLDPKYPSERLNYLIADSEIELVLSHSKVESRLDCKLSVFIDTDIKLDEYSSENLNQIFSIEQAAYVIYTSGSTGKPKGVIVSHRNMLSLLHWSKSTYSDQQLSSILASTSLNFDISTFELFVPLCFGYQCILVENALALLDCSYDLSLINTVPSVIKTLLNYNAIPDSVNTINLAGEPLQSQIVNKILTTTNCKKVCNLYGPSEDTTYSTCAEFTLPTNGTPDIGRVIGNSQAFVLSKKQELMPIGSAGELYLAGEGVTNGYLHRPELTKQKFVQNQLADGLLYRTGDLVKYQSDGKLVFLGRIDDQVKLRGFRIELGEIEHQLLKFHQVDDAVVLVHEEKLVTYIVACEQNELVFKEKLRDFLPEYMIPDLYVFVDELPLTANGKVDKKALLKIESYRFVEKIVQPCKELETKLLGIWADVINIDVDYISTDVSFFELGGHSLLAVNLSSLIRSAFNVKVTLKDIFENTTVSLQANFIENSEKLNTTLKIVPLLASNENNRLSYAQQRLWLLDRISNGSAHYNMSGSLRLSGKLNYQALNRSLTTIVERHESLRTVFTVDEQEAPIQVIQPSSTVDITVHDLSILDAGSRELDISQRVAEEAGRAFDLSADMMLRAQLLKVAEDEHILLVTMHHIASDGWSMGILVKEFSVLYSAFVQGQESPLPPLDIQYADYAHWQRNWLQGEVLEKQVDYWEQQLAGLPEVHSLPLDHPRPKLQSFVGETYQSTLNTETSQALNSQCQSQGATLFMGLHAAFSVLLSRHSNEADIVVGSPIANREQAEIANLIGFFVNTLVLRSDLSASPSFNELLVQSKKMLLDAYAHQQVPFEQIVERLQPERSLSHSPLFQVMLVLQNNAQGELELPGLALSAVEQERAVAKFDLTLNVSETDEGLQLGWEYNTDLFDVSTIERMAGHFNLLLQSLVATPDESVLKVNMLSDAERHQLLVEWNDTAAEYPKDKCIHEIFEQQVIENPDAIAVVFEEGQLTYGELNAKANQLAHYLIEERQVTPDTLVGICVERSLDMVIGIMGILKAGGAYVPLDPAYPQARLQYMLDDSKLSTVVTQQHLLKRTPISAEQAMCLDNDVLQEGLNTYPHENISRLISSNLAYVIYTSGSTGKPKGVMVEHSNLVNFICSMSDKPGMTGADTLLAVTSTSFDIHGLEIFLPLVVGGTMVVAAKEDTTQPAALIKLMEEHQVSIMQATPATWKMLLAEEWQSSIPLKVLCGGEVMSHSLAQGLLGAGSIDLWNMYGPTETTIWSCIKHIQNSEDKITIGTPIGNTNVYVLSEEMTPVPVGSPGELYIGGQGVARGYRHREDLTAQQFITNPFYEPSDLRSSKCLYKTGDRVRWLPQGELEYLERLDHQVKIRGFRIELGEIDYQLSLSSQVRDVLTVVHQTSSGDGQLVAYVVADTLISGDKKNQFIDTLHQHSVENLPDYMVPGLFVLLDTMPLTPNGKVDKKALPKPDISQQQALYIAPETEFELQMAQIWQEVLNTEQIGLNDNFFVLGGHSLLGAQLVSRVRKAFDIEFSARVLFEAPVFKQFVQKVEQSLSSSDNANSTGITIQVRPEHIPLSYEQERLWFIHEHLPEFKTSYNMCSAHTFHGQLSIEYMQKAFTDLVARHESLRTRFVTKGEDLIPVQVIDPRGLINIDVTPTNESEVLALAQKIAKHEFDLVNGPLLKVDVLKLSDEKHILLINIHHIIFDGWSSNVISNEVHAFYMGYVRDKPLSLPDLPIQYADFAIWQRKNDLSAHRAYWIENMAGYKEGLNLPYDFAKKVNAGHPTNIICHKYPAELIKQFTALSRGRNCTLFIGLLTSFSLVLQRYSERDDLCIGTTTAGRDQLELESLIGFFVNILPLRLDLSGEPTFAELMERTRRSALSGFEHQALPFESILNDYNQTREGGESQLVPVILRHQTFLQEQEQWGDEIEVKRLELGVRIAPSELDFQFYGDGSELDVVVEYASDLFTETTIKRMLGHHEQILRAICGDINQKTAGVSLLTPKEEQQYALWNDTAIALQQEQNLAKQFTKIAATHRNHTACIGIQQWHNGEFSGVRELTFGQLDIASNQVAHRLLALGVKPGVRVGLSSDRDLELLVGLIAIFKAGACYVPLDARYPQAYVEQIINDAEPEVIISTSAMCFHLPEWVKVDIELAINEAGELSNSELSRISTCDVLVETKTSDLACLMYTSGSTGKPKGVKVPYIQILNWLEGIWQRQPIKKDDIVVQKTSIAFAVSVKELLSGLLVGVPQIMLTDDIVRNQQALADAIYKWKATRLYMVPSHFQALLSTDDNVIEKLKSLNFVCTAGEALPTALLNEITDRMPWVDLWNNYGCTELNDITYFSPKESEHTTEFVPIGKPIGNTKVYVLDETLQQLPVGVKGELYVHSIGMSQGYWKNPELTASQFIPNPFSQEDDEKLYRTGDLVRFLEDGSLEYLGRSDFEIKVRGHRIDVRQVEAQIHKHEQITEALVTAYKTEQGLQLTLYYVVAGEQSLAHGDLRNWLMSRLPDYMVPTLFSEIEALPRLPNGKLNRMDLPEPERKIQSEFYVAPRTELEEQLSELWKEVLNIEKVSVKDNFFSLGGHSLLATKLVSQINNQLNTDLNVKQIFNSQTIELVAEIIGKERLVEEVQFDLTEGLKDDEEVLVL